MTTWALIGLFAAALLYSQVLYLRLIRAEIRLAAAELRAELRVTRTGENSPSAAL